MRASVCTVAALASLAAAGGENESGAGTIRFEADVYPILKKRCFRCHGPEKQKGNLRLDQREGLFEGPDPEFPPVVPRNPEGSVLVELIRLPTDDPDRMPKKDDPLPEEEVALLVRWVREGAPWEEVASPPSTPRSDVEIAAALARLREGAEDTGEAVDFQEQIRPILSDNCFKCHGPDGADRKAELRLDTPATGAGAFAIREGGRAAVSPGVPLASLLLDRITRDDPDERMPPPDSGRTLTLEQKRLLLRWIEEGAEWREHWAFVPPGDEEPPAAKNAAWPRNDIDRFVLARLEKEGLAPSAEAAPVALIRRAALDLTGLPPTPEEVDVFLAEAASGGLDRAYERVVDRLLAAPRFGEQMARLWLDAARYGDTHGLHLDNYREMWPYRDWVIRAFNDNMPYDLFVTRQLAGDLLPDATLDDRIASGFNRCHVTTSEGGSIDEEVYVRNVVDRTSTFGTVFLGLSLGCAVCHDHKFDPLPQRDFYSLFAFFNNLDGAPLDGNAKAHPPVVQVPAPEQAERLAAARAAVAATEAEIQAALQAIDYEEPDLEWPHADRPRAATIWIDDALPPDAEVDGGDFVWSDEQAVAGARSIKRTSRGNQQDVFRNAGRKLRIGPGDVLFCSVFLDPTDPPREVMLQWNSTGGAGEGSGWLHRAYLGEDLIEYGRDGTGERRRLGDLPQPGRWFEIAVPAEDVGLYPGMVVHGMAFTQFDGTAYYDKAGVDSCTPQQAEEVVLVDDAPPPGAELHGDGATWNFVAQPEHPVLSGERALRRAGAGLNQDFFLRAGPWPLAAGDRLFAHVYLDPDDPPSSVQVQFHGGAGNDWEHRVRLGEPAHGAGAEGGGDFRQGDLPEAGRWQRIEVALGDVGLEPGQTIDGVAFTQVGGTVFWDRMGIVTWSPPDDRPLHSKLAWEQRARGDRSLPEALRAALAQPAAGRDEAGARLVRDHYLRYVHQGSRPIFLPLEAALAERTKEAADADAAIPTTLVMQERAERRPAYVLHRGEYDQQKEEVARATPDCLPPMDPALPSDRLGLARWLLDPGHPLFARVAVNRFWQQMFGTGLVRTAEEFGSQGEPPSHPKLLDWLAVRFRRDGYDLKGTLRRMALSATYRQAAVATPELLARDPDNRLLARAHRNRLDAEVIRDQALFAGGLLVERLGGPSVKPPQPEGLWEAVGYTSSNTARFQADSGHDKVHRRTLYTFLKRTAPAPQLAILDAPNRESCMVRRERTNTPLQALLLLNDPQYVEAARALALLTLARAGDDAARVTFAFRRVVLREPDPGELAELLGLLNDLAGEFAASPERAARLAGPEQDASAGPPAAEVAAFTLIANLLLNLDEALTRS